MKEFIQFLVEQIVNHPESVVIEENGKDGYFDYQIEVDQEDMGIVIGKGGHTIRSIRDLARAKAIIDNVRISVNIKEDDKFESEEKSVGNETEIEEVEENETETVEETPETEDKTEETQE